MSEVEGIGYYSRKGPLGPESEVLAAALATESNWQRVVVQEWWSYRVWGSQGRVRYALEGVQKRVIARSEETEQSQEVWLQQRNYFAPAAARNDVQGLLEYALRSYGLQRWRKWAKR